MAGQHKEIDRCGYNQRTQRDDEEFFDIAFVQHK
jgi:hypothetical protein